MGRNGRAVDVGGAHYAVLGLQRDATGEEIGAAYRRRLRLLAPERHAEVSETVREEARRARSALERAHEVLSDPERRVDYDRRVGRDGERVPPHYVMLGRGVDATAEELQESYRRRVRLLHPDRHAEAADEVRQEAERAMAALNRAHDVLSDPASRRRYDREARIHTRSTVTTTSTTAGRSTAGFTYYPQGSSPPPTSQSAYGPTNHHDRVTVSYGPKGPPDPRTSEPSPGRRRSRAGPSRSAQASWRAAGGESWLHGGGIATMAVVGTIVLIVVVAVATVALGM